MTIEITTHPKRYGLQGYPVAVIQREHGEIVARHPFQNYRAATVAAAELRRRFPSRRRVIAGRLARQAGTLAIRGARLAASPIRRKYQTRITDFRTRQLQKEVALKNKELQLARLEVQLRTTREQIARLRA